MAYQGKDRWTGRSTVRCCAGAVYINGTSTLRTPDISASITELRSQSQFSSHHRLSAPSPGRLERARPSSGRHSSRSNQTIQRRALRRRRDAVNWPLPVRPKKAVLISIVLPDGVRALSEQRHIRLITAYALQIRQIASKNTLELAHRRAMSGIFAGLRENAVVVDKRADSALCRLGSVVEPGRVAGELAELHEGAENDALVVREDRTSCCAGG